MTYFKLSMRNAGRQARDYLVYFVTMVLAAALIFAFNALAVSGEVLALTEILENFSLTIVLASLAVVCVFGWLAPIPPDSCSPGASGSWGFIFSAD